MGAYEWLKNIDLISATLEANREPSSELLTEVGVIESSVNDALIPKEDL